MPRYKLNIQDKNLFKLPLQYRVMGGLDAMNLWIKRAEMGFQKNLMSRKQSCISGSIQNQKNGKEKTKKKKRRKGKKIKRGKKNNEYKDEVE